MFDDHEERSLVAQEDREDLPFENMVRSVHSLTDHLDEQLRYATDDPLVRRIGEEIIGNLDEDGYLRADIGKRRLAPALCFFNLLVASMGVVAVARAYPSVLDNLAEALPNSECIQGICHDVSG